MGSAALPQEKVSDFQSIIAGGIAGFVSRFVISPLDVVKIRLQLNDQSSTIWTTTKNILHNEGVTAFWKGNISGEIMYVLYGAVQFGVYKHMNQVCSDRGLSDGTTMLISGGTAGGAATIAAYPFDLLRTRFIAQRSDRVYESLVDGVRSILRDEGIKGFSRGLGTSLLSMIPYMGTFFLTYGKARSLFTENQVLNKIPVPEMITGVLGGIISKAVVFPFDTLRKRIQITGPHRYKFLGKPVQSENRTPSMIKIVREILAYEGVRGFYRGFSVAIVKGAPTSAVSMLVFEKSIKFLQYTKSEKSQF